MNKKSFSLLEIIFAISLIGILLTVAIPKFQNSMKKTYLADIQTHILLIREGIVRESNKFILANSSTNLETLDEDSTYLFSKVLQTPIIASSDHTIGSWEKTTTNEYKVYISDDTSVIFSYDPSTYSFECDWNDINCRKLSQ